MTRARVALALVALFAGALAAAFTWQASLASLYDDSVSYLLMAKALSPFSHAPAPVLDAALREKYPPLFPLLLAISGGAEDWRIAHAVVAISFAASVFLLGAYAARISASGAIGIAAALAYAALPGTWLNVKGILSEFPFMALAFAALLLHERLRDRAPSNAASVALGALLAAAFLTRTIGALLAIAILAAEALRYRRTRERERLRHVVIAGAIAAVAAAAWYALRPSVGEDPYAVYGGRVAEGGIEQAAAMAWINADALVGAWLNALLIFWGEPWRPGFLGAAALGLAALAAVGWRAARGDADGLFVALFIGVLLAWPFPGQMFRLAFPAIPLAIALALWAADRLLRRFGPPRLQSRAAWFAAVPIALALPPSLLYIGERARGTGLPEDARAVRDISEFYRIPSGPAAVMNALRQLATFEDLRRIGESTPPEARVMAYAPPYVALFAERFALPLEHPRDAADLARQVREARAGFIYVGRIHPRDSANRLGDPMEAVAAARGFTSVVWQRGPAGRPDAVLLRVEPDRLPGEAAGGRVSLWNFSLPRFVPMRHNRAPS
jgi:hypothetical protein